MQFRIPGLPPSYNTNFKINYSFRQIYLSREARAYKTKVKMYTPVPKEDYTNMCLSIRIDFNHDWYFLNKKQRKLDVQNLDKILIDSISESLGIDDCQFWTVLLNKVQNKDDSYVDVTIDII